MQYFKSFFTKKRMLELTPDLTVMTSIMIGTQSVWGSALYVAAISLWWWLIFDRKMWGMVPTHILWSGVGAYNVYACYLG